MNNEEPELSELRLFIVCQSCGQMIPSQSLSCEYCGAASPHAQQIGDRKLLTDLFSRAAFFTPTLIGINVAIYLLITLAAGGDRWQALISGADVYTLLAFGAQNGELLKNGEWFRLITPAFVHIGLLHLAMNSYALWSVGMLVEKLYGSARFLAIYLLTAAGGSLASFINHSIKHDDFGASAGASGAIFGLFGVVAVFSYKYRGELPEQFLKNLKSGVLPAIAINLVIGFSIKYVDNAAHIGGLLTGALLAFLIPYIPANVEKRISRSGLAILAACIVVTLTCFAFAYRQSPPLMERQFVKVEAFLNNIESANAVIINIFRSISKNEDWKPSPEDISQLTTVAEALEKNRSLDTKTEQIRLELIRLSRELKQVVTQPNIEAFSDEELGPIAEKFMETRSNYADWLKSEGPRYGFELKKASDEQKK